MKSTWLNHRELFGYLLLTLIAAGCLAGWLRTPVARLSAGGCYFILLDAEEFIVADNPPGDPSERKTERRALHQFWRRIAAGIEHGDLDLTAEERQTLAELLDDTRTMIVEDDALHQQWWMLEQEMARLGLDIVANLRGEQIDIVLAHVVQAEEHAENLLLWRQLSDRITMLERQPMGQPEETGQAEVRESEV